MASESRSTSLSHDTANLFFSWSTFDEDLDTLQQASEAFLTDRMDGECACFHDKFVLPGEKFLYENDTLHGLNTYRPTAESFFGLIDSIVASGQDSSDHLGMPQKHEFYSMQHQNYVSYTALDELVLQGSWSADLTSSKSPPETTGDFEDDSDDIGEFPTQGYYDAATSSFVAYTALNQLQEGLDDEDVLPRIHHDNGHGNEELYDDLTVDILEIGDHTAQRELLTSSSSPLAPTTPNLFDLLFYTWPAPQGGHRARLTSASQQGPPLHSNTSYRPKKSRRRPQLTIITHLDIIQETSEGSKTPSPKTTSSTSSMDFSGHRHSLQPLLTRKASFISDSDEDSPHVTDFSGYGETNPDSSLIVHVENTNALFDDDVWSSEPDLALAKRREFINGLTV